MMVALIIAVLLQVAPAEYDASFSCDCRLESAQTSGVLTATGHDESLAVDYPKVGSGQLLAALQSARRIAGDAPSAQSTNWHSSITVVVQGQKFNVPVDAVLSQSGGAFAIASRGSGDASLGVLNGTLSATVDVELSEVFAPGKTADDPALVRSIDETIVIHFPARGAYVGWDATYKIKLAARAS